MMARFVLVAFSGLVALTSSEALGASNRFIAGGGGALPGDHHRMMQEEDIPEVGIVDLTPICDSSSTSECISSDQDAQEELIEELEADDEVTATSVIELGALLCGSLAEASESTLLRFAISSNETVIAELTSYSEIDGAAFTDNSTRKVWRGEVVDPEPAADASPRIVSMTWGTPCDVETFVLKIVKDNPDGTTTITTSVPCDIGSSADICIVQYDVELQIIGEPLVLEQEDVSSDVRRLMDSHTAIGSQEARMLQPTTEIDVMVLYSPESLSRVVSVTAEQMESLIADELPASTEAAVNSEIDVKFNLVHTAMLPYNQASEVHANELNILRTNEIVGTMRDDYRADVVVLVGSFPGGCGLGYVNANTAPSHEASAFSVVDAICLNGKTITHEIGHNMGCYHDRDNSVTDSDYSHGLRYCSGDEPFVTLMAYPCNQNPPEDWNLESVERVNYFSNPDVSKDGRPTGTDTENNAQTIRDNMAVVSNFRIATMPAPTPAPTDVPSITPAPTAVTELSTCFGLDIEGIEGSNDNGTVCCPLGCNQCGGPGCATSGAVAGLTNMDCCINGVLGSADLCTLALETPCIMDDDNMPSPTPAPVAGSKCFDLDIEGIEGSNDNGAVCCPLGCNQCGGPGCATSGRAAGLTNIDCCINGVLGSGSFCAKAMEAPCIS